MDYDTDEKLQEIINNIKQGIDNGKLKAIYPYKDKFYIKISVGNVGSVNQGTTTHHQKTFSYIVKLLSNDEINDECKEILNYIKQILPKKSR